jgi:hypothetical protein
MYVGTVGTDVHLAPLGPPCRTRWETCMQLQVDVSSRRPTAALHTMLHAVFFLHDT